MKGIIWSNGLATSGLTKSWSILLRAVFKPFNTDRIGASRKPVPVFDYPLSKEMVPNAKSETLPAHWIIPMCNTGPVHAIKHNICVVRLLDWFALFACLVWFCCMCGGGGGGRNGYEWLGMWWYRWLVVQWRGNLKLGLKFKMEKTILKMHISALRGEKIFLSKYQEHG